MDESESESSEEEHGSAHRVAKWSSPRGLLRHGLAGILGFLLGASWVVFTDELDDSGCVDLEDLRETSWTLAPIRAWRKRNRALQEVAENPFTIMLDSEYAEGAYRQRTSHYRAFASVVGSVVTALVTAKVARQ